MVLFNLVKNIFKNKNECLFNVGDTVCLCNNKNIKGLLCKALLDKVNSDFVDSWERMFVMRSSKTFYLTKPENMSYLKSTRMVLTEKTCKFLYWSDDVFQGGRKYKYIAKVGAFNSIFKELIWTEEDVDG